MSVKLIKNIGLENARNSVVPVSCQNLNNLGHVFLMFLKAKNVHKRLLRTVSTSVTAHTFCASRDTPVSYGWFLLIQRYFLRGLKLCGESRP